VLQNDPQSRSEAPARPRPARQAEDPARMSAHESLGHRRLTPLALLSLQRTFGNRAVCGIVDAWAARRIQRAPFRWPFDARQIPADPRQTPVEDWPGLVALLAGIDPDRLAGLIKVKSQLPPAAPPVPGQLDPRAAAFGPIALMIDLVMACKRFASRYLTNAYKVYESSAPDIPGRQASLAAAIAVATGQTDESAAITRYVSEVQEIGMWEDPLLYDHMGAGLNRREVEAEAAGRRLPRVVVSGAGPAGLAAAIEARMAGAEVILLEKRGAYTRDNAITLRSHAIDKLKYFGVWEELFSGPSPKGLLDRGGQPGISIRFIEEALLHRALQLGVQFERGKVVASVDARKGAPTTLTMESVTEPRDSQTIPYDILVAADAKTSEIRGLVTDQQIISMHKNRAIVYAAAVLDPAANAVIGAEIVKDVGTFHVSAPNVYYVLMEVPAKVLFRARDKAREMQELRAGLEGQEMGARERRGTMDACFQTELTSFGIKVATKSKHFERASGGATPRVKKVSPFEVELTQARYFADPKTNMILVGDAAATTNPFEGQGASTAIFESGLVGELVGELAHEGRAREAAMNDYSFRMREITTRLMLQKPIRQRKPDYYARPGIVWRDDVGNYYVSQGDKEDAGGQPRLEFVPTPGRSSRS
jgi:2-polyprenyl-6-methoxyphenol hydroxylase-like FAD-dependent oxidoreductase